MSHFTFKEAITLHILRYDYTWDATARIYTLCGFRTGLPQHELCSLYTDWILRNHKLTNASLLNTVKGAFYLNQLNHESQEKILTFLLTLELTK